MLRLRSHFWLASILLASLLPLIQAQAAINMQPSTTIAIVEDDESQLRGVINEYFNALRNKDWQRLDAIEETRVFGTIINGSDSHGPLLPYNISIELNRRLLAPYKIETLGFTIDKLMITGPEATVHVRVNIRAYETDTGAKVIDFVNLRRVLRLGKCQCSPGNPWKLNLDTADGPSLEDQIKLASTPVERQFLYVQENLSDLDKANRNLKKEGLRLLEQESLDQAFSVFGLAQEIDEHSRHRSIIVAEIRLTQREIAITRYRTSGQHKDLAMNLLWAGQDYAELNDYAKAESYIGESINLLGPLEDRQSLAKAFGEMASVYLGQNNYSHAATSYQNSIDNYLLVAAAEDKQEQSSTIDEMDDVIIRLAYLYSAQGKYELAEKSVQNISEKLKSLGATEDALLLTYVIAILEMARGDNVQAVKDMEQLLLRIEQSSQRIEDQDEIIASIRLMLAMLYSQQSNFTAAARQFEKMRQTKIRAENAEDMEG